MNSRRNDSAFDALPDSRLERRQFLQRLIIGIGALGTAAVGLPLIGYLIAPLIQKIPRAWRAVGPADNFAVGKTVLVAFEDASPVPWSGATARTGSWLRRTGQTEFIAFSIDCTHLGCPVRWEPEAELFMCPCHGGVYYKNGDVAAGPPPLPLRRYPVRIRGKEVEIQAGPIPIT
jgi:menaquinol-cytochrome c reductase iron-sulfur subunit